MALGAVQEQQRLQRRKSISNHASDHLHHRQPMDRIRLREGHFDGFRLSGKYM